MSESQIFRRQRRHHTPEFKRQVVALCQPGVSTSAVALAHGVNANMLRRWIRESSEVSPQRTSQMQSKLVPVQVEVPIPTQTGESIEIDIQRNGMRIGIRWPVQQAGVCAEWLGAWVK
jgi:transposase-like protein